jgi:hypothetical protein
MKYGVLNLFAAALLAIVSTAIHLHTPVFKIARFVMLLYLLFSASSSIVCLISASTSTFLRVWVAVRTISALSLLGNDIGEMVRSSNQPLGDIPGWDHGESSSSNVSSAGSEHSSDASEHPRHLERVAKDVFSLQVQTAEAL